MSRTTRLRLVLAVIAIWMAPNLLSAQLIYGLDVAVPPDPRITDPAAPDSILSAASRSAETAGSASPKTVEEGLQRLERLLGKFESKNARQFRIPIDQELTNQPEANKPPVLVAGKGEIVIGNPYRTGGAAAFDLLESVKRTIYELGDGGARTVVRRQQRYMAARWTLRVDENGVWQFDTTFLAHSIPYIVGKPYLTGTVKWRDEGVELVGVGTENAYASDGSLIPVAVHGRIKFTRDGEQLVIDDQWQCYQRAADPDGTLLPVPDFSRPVGTPSPWLAGKATRE